MYKEEFLLAANVAKSKVSLLKSGKQKYLIASILAGFYIGLGIMLIFTIGGLLSSAQSPMTKIVMGLSFGVALSLVIAAGAELFTGNNFVMTAGILKKTITMKSGIVLWIFNFIGNLIGSVVGGYLYVLSGVSNEPINKFIVNISYAKMHGAPIELIIRGFFCNVLVCLAVWTTFRLKNESARLIMVFWCLFAFITTGFEHSIANMTLLTIGLLVPHPETVNLAGYLYNIGLVTIGNMIGGILLAVSYWIISKES